tara:strand:+ start:2789 stop:3748 length:960 start_codon:yes stop_codon:yes gene_type:complete
MCGIGGFYNVTGVKTPVAHIASMWCALEDRGTHAHGMAFNWVGADKPVVSKNVGPASDSKNKIKKYLSGNKLRFVLLHTRYTTQGSTKNMGNNHPIVRDGITLTHNGVLRNDRQVFSHLGVKPLYQVDSEAINVALRARGVRWLADNVKGSMSIAWIDEKDSTQNVHLFTNGGNPLVIARTKCGNIVWASCLYHIQESGFKIKTHFNAMPYKEYILRPDGAIMSKWISKNRKMANISTWHSSHKTYYNNDNVWDWESSVWEDIDNKANAPVKPSRVGKTPSKVEKFENDALSASEMALDDDWAYNDSRGWFRISEVEWF